MHKPITHHIPGLVLTDHYFSLPLDHNTPAGETITVFAREIVAPDKEQKDLPWLVFLQGGPGFEAPRPQSKSGWLKRALQEYRVLMLDQRGTGKSTKVLSQTLAKFKTPQEQAGYLMNFRADSIVRDAEQIRKTLVGENEKWSILGQSYGGFCAVTYLSCVPEGLREVIITGGLPPLTQHPDEVYRLTYNKVLNRNQEYFRRYPGDQEIIRRIVEHLKRYDITLPNGEPLTARKFQQLGMPFGMSNGFELRHYLLEDPFVEGVNGPELSYAFLREVENVLPFNTNPIYAILHEPIYCQGFASNWSAERVRSEFPEFELSPDQPIMFTGEMIYPWMFDEYKELRPIKEAAEILAAYEDWPPLYDLAMLAKNEVPTVASTYYNDMYCPLEIAEDAAQKIAGIRLWITNELEHSGLRLHGERLLDRLLGMLHGEY